METIITLENFNEEVLNSDRPVLIDFWAPWCGPCRMLAPVIEQIDKEYPEIKVCKINVDEQQELAASFKVSSIPTVIVVKDGAVTKRSVGYLPKKQLVDLVQN